MEVPFSHQLRPPPSRKLRKGTFSCVECKRRKRRCDFQSSSSSSSCTSCKRRGLPCVSQIHDPARDQHEVAERVNHVEDLVTLLLQQRRYQGVGLSLRGATASDLAAMAGFPRSPCGSSISIASYLRSVFPSPSEAGSILSDQIASRMPFQILWSNSASVAQDKGHPPPEAHPIWFGRKFMELALCLQDVKDPSGTAARYVDIVSRHVSSLDILTHSVEGVETLMLEAVYYINDDKPKAAWLKCRRALSIAQLLLLEHPEWDLSQILSRLIYGDRIISLELGLPYLGVSGPASLTSNENPRVQLENAHSAIASRIIERNIRLERGYPLTSYDKEAREMDNMMKSAINHLPLSWWSVKDSLFNMEGREMLEETSNLATQLNHYWFLMQIHLPFLIAQLRSVGAPANKLNCGITIATACRQVLSRFVTIRTYHNGDVYRGTDTKAISAATMLVLAHIEAHRPHSNNEIQHLRPQDIDLVREMLVMLDNLYRSEARGSEIRNLLEIEADAARGGNYFLVDKLQDGLPLSIPYVGDVKLVKMSLLPHQESQCDSLQALDSIPIESPGLELEGDLFIQDLGPALDGYGPNLQLQH